MRRLVEEAEAAGPGEAAGLRDGAASFGLEEVDPAPADYRGGDRRRLAPPLRRSAARGTLTKVPDPARAAVRRKNAAARQEEAAARRMTPQRRKAMPQRGKGTSRSRPRRRRCRSTASTTARTATSPARRWSGSIARSGEPTTCAASASCSIAALPPAPPSWARSRPRIWPAPPRRPGSSSGASSARCWSRC